MDSIIKLCLGRRRERVELCVCVFRVFVKSIDIVTHNTARVKDVILIIKAYSGGGYSLDPQPEAVSPHLHLLSRPSASIHRRSFLCVCVRVVHVRVCLCSAWACVCAGFCHSAFLFLSLFMS